jgi:chemotaxis protein methyltransferase CheR
MKQEPLAPSMRRLATLLEIATGQTLSESRLWRLETALQPLLRDHGLPSLGDLVDRISQEPEGVVGRAVVNALLNNETSFFRDAHVFRMLGRQLFPDMLRQIEARDGKRPLRLWCAGCSTGQEAYSLAMTFCNVVEGIGPGQVKILATDVSTAAIERAKSGMFGQIDVQRGLPINDLLRWFEPKGDEWQVDRSLRDIIDFRVDNLFDDMAVRGEFDIVLCRNVLIYFSAERKRALHHLLARHCRVGGYLLLGAGETVIGQTGDFSASQRYRGVYQRIDPRHGDGASA